MMKKIIFLLLLITNSFAFAQSNLYQINVIIFKHITDQALYSEYWPNQLFTPYLKNALVLNAQDSNTQSAPATALQNPFGAANYFLAPDNQTGLQREASLLSRQSDYQILAHLSWVQPITSPRAAKWIQIHGGQAYDAQGQPINADADNLIDANNMTNIHFWELNGKIKIGQTRYFDIYTRLYLTEPESIIGGETDEGVVGIFQPIPLRSFTLFKHQRARLNDLNYFDHPLFGAIIQITKYQGSD